MTTSALEHQDRSRADHDALAIAALLGSTAAAFWFVPSSVWGDLVEPTARTIPMMIVVVAALLWLRRGGPRGARREKRLLSIFLAAMPLVYLESGVLHGAGSALAFEVLGLVVFAAWAWLAYRRDVRLLALGIAAHGIAWDSWHHGSSYIASWYASACLVVDVGLAGYIVLQRRRLNGVG